MSILRDSPLSREELINVITGQGGARRVPMLYHFWVSPDSFPEKDRAEVRQLLSEYPMDVQLIPLNIPSVYDAPADDPGYRWSYTDRKRNAVALDNSGFIEDWDTELDKLLSDFPSPDYPGLIPVSPESDGRYRLGLWWYFYFERFWSIRNMEEALMDFYTDPQAVHALFKKLTEFYIRMLDRAKAELGLDGVFTSDDLGTQASTFFSPKIFDEFFAPYYKQVIDHAHELGMHFWLHTCGNVEKILPRLFELGVDVIHPIQKYAMDEVHIAQKFGGSAAIWAGFDVQQTIPYGTPADVRKEARHLIDTYARKDGRFLLTMGNQVTGDTPVESLKTLFYESLYYGTEKMQKLR